MKKKSGKKYALILSVAMVISLFLPQTSIDVQAAIASLALNDTFVDGNISEAGAMDKYTIVLPSSGWLTLTYEGLSIGDSIITLLDGDESKLYYSNFVSESSETETVKDVLTLALEEGSYTATVQGNDTLESSYTGTYRIKADFSSAGSDETEPNNGFEASMPLTINQQVTGFLSEDDLFDFYKIEAPSNSTIRTTLQSWIASSGAVSDDNTLSVYDSGHNLIQGKNLLTSRIDSPSLTTMDVVLNKGTYYLEVNAKELGFRKNKGKYKIKWEKLPTPVEKITITGTNTVKEGSSVSLTATVSPSNADNKTLKWTSLNPEVATVDSTGKVTGIKAGDALIKAEATDGSGKYQTFGITVERKTIPVKSISVSGSNHIFVGDSTGLKATVSPDDATNKQVTWSSSNEAVASVDVNGNVTGKSEGTVFIYAKAKDGSGIEGKLSVEVEVARRAVFVSGIEIYYNGKNDYNAISITSGDTAGLTAVVTPNNATNRNVKWISSDPSVASVDADGNVTAKKAGEAVITAEAQDGSGKRGKIKITVEKKIIPVTKIVIKGEKVVRFRNRIRLTASVYPDNATNKSLNWYTYESKNIVQVDQSGRVTNCLGSNSKNKNVTITAIATDGSGVKGSYTVSVINKHTAPPASNIVKKVSSVKAKALGKKTVKVSWKNQSKALGYEIQINKERNFEKGTISKMASKGKGNQSITIELDKKQRRAYVRVRAFDKYGYVGKWSALMKVKFK